MISILILTLNEEINLKSCLESLKWSDDIVVLDCGSTDRTVEIASDSGARVVTHSFDNWSSQLNWALKNCTFAHDWVYNCDADEIVTPELRDELICIAERTDNKYVAYRLRYKNFFLGKWIKHCGLYPTWVMRFYKADKVRWERLVNPAPVVDGLEGRLENHFEHYSFNKGLSAWFDKHNKYSSQEAEETLKSLESKRLDLRGLFTIDPAQRRKAIKELSFRLPFRPILRFVYMYFFRLGLLDGRPGLTYCMLLTIYEYMTILKVDEIRRREKISHSESPNLL